MPKTILQDVQDALENHSSSIALMFKIEMDEGTTRACSMDRSLFWDEGEGEEEYVGVGILGSISSAEESADLSSFSMEVTLSGIPPVVPGDPNFFYTKVLNVDYRQKPAYIYLATLDDNLEIIGDPILIFAGTSDTANINVEREASISLNIISRLADWERPRGGRFTDQYQRTYVDSGDKGFQYVDQMGTLELSWSGNMNGYATRLQIPTTSE